jgi:signal transduction histidine kinase
VLAGGPGWVILGVLKMLGGALLAYLAISHMVPPDRAVDPNQMYLAAYEYVFPHYGFAVAATAVFVVVSQLKINVTNAYAGSLAWSNFFSRVTHSHPGRVVWVVFNTLIAFMLMEMNVFQALGDVLGLYSNIAIAWIMAVVADLVVNKPLGLSPKGIEFKRAYLYDINPVGVGAMALASTPRSRPSWACSVRWRRRSRRSSRWAWPSSRRPPSPGPPRAATTSPARRRAGRPAALRRCVVCEREYEAPDMAHCPAYQGCRSARCAARSTRAAATLQAARRGLAWQWSALLRALLPRRTWTYLDTGLGHFLLLMLVIVPLLARCSRCCTTRSCARSTSWRPSGAFMAGEALRAGFVKVYFALLVIAGIVAWWLVLAHKSRQVAQEESNRQTHLLVREIESHRQTDEALAAGQARRRRGARAAEQANQAKSRYIGAISHELRTPLNSILGYAQLMGEDAGLPPHRKQAVNVIRRGGEHLLSLIEGTLDIARIEAGKLTLAVKPMRFADCVHEMANLFELQATGKGLGFRFDVEGAIPEVVRADEKRVRQILINLLGNAVKFTAQGRWCLRVRHAREMADIEVATPAPA